MNKLDFLLYELSSSLWTTVPRIAEKQPRLKKMIKGFCSSADYQPTKEEVTALGAFINLTLQNLNITQSYHPEEGARAVKWILEMNNRVVTPGILRNTLQHTSDIWYQALCSRAALQDLLDEVMNYLNEPNNFDEKHD